MENNQLNSPDTFMNAQRDKGNEITVNKQINPNFSDVLNPATIKNELNKARDKAEAEQKREQNPFPIDVFPEAIQQVITATNETLKFPIDFTGASILYATSVAIGNGFKVRVKEGWNESPILYIALVGRPGTNKSHPLGFVIEPFQRKDNFNFEKYQKEKAEFDRLTKLKPNELEKEGITELKKPFYKQLLVSDFTPEALTEVHKFNPIGLGVYNDELAAWVHNFARYTKKGSEAEFWLSNWSSKPVRINRKNSEPIFILSPFISVIGGIQPGILNELAENRTENGFVDRILFAVPDNLKKEISEKELNPEIIENWNNIILNILGLQTDWDGANNPQPKIIEFAPEAKKILYKWRENLTYECNKPENEAVCGIFTKIEMYVIRFSLILQMLQYGCKESNLEAIGIEAVKGAIKLGEYFKKTAIKVNSIISDLNPLETMDKLKQDVYNALPDTFETGEGVKTAKQFNMSERTFKRFLDNKKLFNKTGFGTYERRY